MKIPIELEDQYVKNVLYNISLLNLPGEEWKPIENFENYAISNYGRVKSLERWITSLNGKERKAPDRIMKLQFMKFFNKYLNENFYNITCLLSSEGRRSRKSVPRLVYHHFVEKLDSGIEPFLISFKDGNRFHLHADNLEKLSISEDRFKRVRENRVRNSQNDHERAISQYTVEGELIGTFENIGAANDTLSIGDRNILYALNKERLTAGGYRWFFKDYTPKKEDFIISTESKSDSSGKLLNKSLWEKLGKPPIDKNSPPACMNLSLNDLPREHWKPVTGLENGYLISNKGRVKRLGSWTTSKNKSFWKERIMSINLRNKYGSHNPYFYILLNRKGQKILLSISRLLYYSFVKEFDMNDKTLVIVNENEPRWNLDVSKLKLKTRISLLKGKSL
ncbi:NUMOD4 domain-containing protein [Chryseobacterium paludis]|uniref:NUMOD4 domain-containing protein n=1 Tax=Chryseobacterium paludis TaxID=2956784 RepID=UPI0021C1BF94|nr:NUMOD4 domain-containing protein [Chryseobacterium paludis]